MSAAALAVVVWVVSIIGGWLFRRQAGESPFCFPFMDPAAAAVEALRDAGFPPGSREVGVSLTGACFYDVITRQVCLTPEVSRRRDLVAVSIALHEAGHAIQHRRIGMIAFYSLSLFPAAVFTLAFVDLLTPVPEAVPMIIGGLVVLRALVELDAWMVATWALRRWKLPPVPWRLIVAGVMSYL